MSTHHGSPRGPSSYVVALVTRAISSRSIGSRWTRCLPSHRSLVGGIAGALLLAGAAQAAVEITVDKSAQRMTVAVDGVQRWVWPVSSGVPSHETPNGSFKAFRMEEDHYSKEWDDAPMPHSIFFTKVGHAIHGTDSVQRLGTPASHGCVRLSREHAAQLYALVEKEGVLNTTVTLTGSAQTALARGPARSQVARGEALGDPVQLAPQADAAQTSLNAGMPDTTPGSDVMYVDRYGRPLDLYVTRDGRRVYRLRPQVREADAVYPRPAPAYQPRGPFGLFQ
jgi:hypothetical protein